MFILIGDTEKLKQNINSRGAVLTEKPRVDEITNGTKNFESIRNVFKFKMPKNPNLAVNFLRPPLQIRTPC